MLRTVRLKRPSPAYNVQQTRHFISATAALVLAVFNPFSESNRLADSIASNPSTTQSVDDANKFIVNRSKVEPWKRPEKAYPEHVPLYPLEKLALFVGSSIGCYFHPERGDLVAALGEATAIPPIMNALKEQMLSDATGRRILRERPRITSSSLNLPYLRSLPEGTVGRTYIDWLDREGVSPDTRAQVRYIDDAENAYVMQRYRECHDFYHALTGLPIIIEGEIALKAFEFANTGIPMTGLGALFAPLRLKPKQKQRLYSIYFPWAIRNGLRSKPIINVYWEEILEKDSQELRDELGIEMPPDLRSLRKSMRKKKNP